jgi:hypothetical protein
MTRHPKRLIRRNRTWLLWLVALAAAGAIWGGAFPACAAQARESWSHSR